MDMDAAKEARDRFLQDLQKAQGASGVSQLLSHQMFERTPAIFGDNRAAWVDWKTRLAVSLEIDPLSIVLVGSAALGFSPTVGKNMKFFGPESDIDVAVISPHHFDLAWHELRFFNDHSRYPAQIREVLESHETKYVYWGTIATDRVLMCFDFGKRWSLPLKDMREHAPTLDREINVRLYRDPASLRTYQVRGLLETRNELSRRKAVF
jgi:predicted nucleotidyltransferase